MKKIIFFALAVMISPLIITQLSCNKSIHQVTSNIPALNPSNEDTSAGTWRLVLLSRPDSFAVAVPAATNSSGYVADLNEIKGLQRNLSSDDEQKINYWAAGNTLRWNEIMRDLVAKYNLPPYQNTDGTYPIPSSANPFAYPNFPFSNPPYAARAYAYVSAAQYDALVACWHYKQLYHRAAPYKVDSSVQAKVTRTTLPAYPSEAAVLAGVTAELMKSLFPDEIANIQQKAQEAELAAIESGAAARSDINAGEALGRQVADLFIARAKTDNASVAVGNATIWAGLATQTAATGQTPWKSLEVPARPPMLPLFGNVKPFLFDSATVVSLRPGPPPSTSSSDMTQQVKSDYDQIKDPTRDQIRIVQFWADGVGTYTPPGHWNYIASMDFITQNFSEVRWARNLALLNMAEMDAGIVCWNTKYFYFNPRPTQIDPAVKTLTGVPNFPSYISGHATFSEAAATILGHIIPSQASKYEAMSQEASKSRFISGIHTEIDCSAGLQVGQNIGNYAVTRATNDGADN